MERVTGIGGVFMRSRDPAALARWYTEHLGVDAYSEEADATWWQSEGPTVWAPFAADTYVFNLYSPTPAITLGPRGGNAHAADEYVLVDDVVDLVRIYARAIFAWCG